VSETMREKTWVGGGGGRTVLLPELLDVEVSYYSNVFCSANYITPL
jgi:hypothetical protein